MRRDGNGSVSPQREHILGHPVHAVSRPEAVHAVVERAREGSPGAYVCLTNAHTTVESQRSPGLRRSAEGSYLSVPDGMPLVWILRRRGHAATQKVTGIEYIPMVARAGLEFGLRHYFYGGAPGVAAAAGERLTRLVPGTQVVGASSPPFSDGWEVSDIQPEIEKTRPHIVWVGLGAPKQEMWMAHAAPRLDVPVMVGVGAGFDFLAGNKRAAPRVMSEMGLEWLFRLITEPRRLWRRYLLGNSKFVYLLLRDALLARQSGDGRRGRLKRKPTTVEEDVT
jgi:N-acetylglucosaminyldiphosphoundecaprenol N-acetyl-beta-D-mannosaminyltransferase